jgi:hypothetical protein
MVNGKTTGFVVTPGAYLTVAGVDLGDTMGQVNLIGNFPGGAAALRVVEWKAGSVYALLPGGLRGAPDQTVTLQLVTAAQKTYRKDGGNFVATREDTTATTNIPRFLKFQSSPGWGGGMDESGKVYRGSSGDGGINCPSPGSDTVTLLDPGKGFVVTGLNGGWGRMDSGDGADGGGDGSRTYTPGYGFGDWNGNSIAIRWGVWRSHTSPTLQVAAFDQCLSSYTISVTLSGPAGVSPF